MKKFFLFAVVLFAVLSLNAQFGIKGGLNISGMSTDISVDGSKMGLGMHVGALYEHDLVADLLSIRFEALYSQKGYDIYNKTTVASVDMISDVVTNINYIEVPVLAKVELGPVFVTAGPYFGVALNGKNTVKTTLGTISTTNEYDLFDENGNLKKSDIGLQAGAGLEFGLPFAKAFFEARGSFGMVNLYDVVVADEYAKNLTLMLSLGLKLGE